MFDTWNPAVLNNQLNGLSKTVTGLKEEIETRVPDYSETEKNTGIKWINGKEIYSKVITGVFPEITTTSNQVIGILMFDTIIKSELNYTATNGIIKANNNILYNKTTNNITILTVTSSFSEYGYTLIVYYTKPDPTP